MIQKIRRAGVLDDFIFFITTDPDTDPTGIHPFLAQGTRRGNSFDVVRLAEDVEDMQVAYGVDGIITGATDNALTVQPPVAPALNVGSERLDGRRRRRVGSQRDRRRRRRSTAISSSSSRSSRGTPAPRSPSTAPASTA